MTQTTIILLLGSVLLLSACEKPAPPVVNMPVASELETLVVEPSTLTRETVFDGRIEAINQSTVSAQTTGRIKEMPFDVGDYVEAGSLIISITDDEQQARVASAQAAVREALAMRTQANAQLSRVQEIFDQKLVARAELDNAISSRDAAEARLSAAQAALNEAEQALGYTTINAPFAGIVVEKYVEPGETVTLGSPLMAGLSLEQLRAVVDVPQHHMAAVRNPGQARVILPDGRSVQARTLRLPPNADPETGTFRVRVDLPVDDYGIFPGTLVKVAFISGELTTVMLPEQALARRGEVTGAYVIDEQDRLQFRYLRIGAIDDNGLVPVLSGLIAGERVASDAVLASQSYRGQES